MAPSIFLAPDKMRAKESSRPLANQSITSGIFDCGSGNCRENACELTTARLNQVAIPSSSTRGSVTEIVVSASCCRTRSLGPVPRTGGSPGFNPREKDGYLFNKIGFNPPGPNSQPLPSNVAPLQKFLWWDGGINDADRGKTFKYTITPVRGTGPKDLVLQHDAETTISVTLPRVEEDGIATWFNRAVVSSQAFSREFPDPQSKIPQVMDSLANGLEDSFARILAGAKEVDGAIYHLTDKRWVVPALKGFKGDLSLVYEDRSNDTTDRPAIKLIKSPRFEGKPRSKTNIMHDKFLVDVKGGRVLMGSANFTPEGLTSQANLLHIFNSPQLAKLYVERQQLIADDPTIGETAKEAGWSRPIKIGKTTVRVFFSPEPTNKRVSIDTVIASVKGAKSSVIFCMFDPTDPKLITSLLATSDRKKLLGTEREKEPRRIPERAELGRSEQRENAPAAEVGTKEARSPGGANPSQ